MIKSLIPLVSVLMLVACTPAEYKNAEQQYLQAIESGNLKQRVSSLKILASFDQNKYQQEFDKTNQAYQLLVRAKNSLSKGDMLAAYLQSHQSFRLLPLNESKQVLIKSGRPFYSLVLAYKALENSFQANINELITIIEKHAGCVG